MLARFVHLTIMRLATQLALLLFTSSVLGAPGLTTATRLVLSHQTARPGETVWAGVQFRLEPGWHIYWENSGDSGIPTRVEWAPTSGLTVGELRWPMPERFEEAGLVTYGYSSSVVLLAPIAIASNAASGPLTLKAKVSWMECAKTCVPGSAPISATLTIGPETRPGSESGLLDQWQPRMPLGKPEDFARAWWEKPASAEPVRPLVIEWPVQLKTTAADFYAFTLSNATLRSSAEPIEAPAGRVRVRKEVEKQDGDWPQKIRGLLIERRETEPRQAAFQVTLSVAEGPSGPGGAGDVARAPGQDNAVATGDRTSGAEFSQSPLVLWFGYAFLGGLILNLMPCVLPVIALKIFGFVAQSQDAPGRVRKLGLVYLCGVLVSFLVLAGLVIGLKSLGKQASWGMQFSDARLLVILTTLVMLVALNLFGIFEVTLGGGTMSAASNLAAKEGASGAFFNGVLATVLSTPCSAPFMASALGFAFAKQTSNLAMTLIFLSIGLGLAFPYVVLSFQPRWLKFLPKPGPWMEKFKVLMGFPMLATAVWLFTLTSAYYQDVLWLGFFLVIVALAAWVFGQFVQHGQTRRPLAVAMTLLLLAVGYGYGLETKQRWRTPQPPSHAGGEDEIIQEGPDGIQWRRWSPVRIQQARAQGRPVFVDFTAKWCVTCNLNKNTSIEIDSVRKKLKEINALPLLGDYTAFPPEITEELQRFGRAAVPLVLVYPKDPSKPPVELPALLTPGIVLDALDQAAK
jgi:thiol:disulfide interchange protein